MVDFTIAGAEEQLLTRVAYLESISALQSQPGWAHLAKHFEDVTNAVQTQILNETDHNEIIRLQERYRAFKSLTEAVTSFHLELEKARQELTELREAKLFAENNL